MKRGVCNGQKDFVALSVVAGSRYQALFALQGGSKLAELRRVTGVRIHIADLAMPAATHRVVSVSLDRSATSAGFAASAGARCTTAAPGGAPDAVAKLHECFADVLGGDSCSSGMGGGGAAHAAVTLQLDQTQVPPITHASGKLFSGSRSAI